MRVLLVEDDEVIAEMVALILHESGYVVDRVSGVDEALASITCSPPSLVLLDLSLSRSSGLTFLRACREAPGLANLPIVFLSGAPHPRPEPGVTPDAIVEKPFNIDDLSATVHQLVRATEPVAT
jgi:DNA-binding response OmpR family regulator